MCEKILCYENDLEEDLAYLALTYLEETDIVAWEWCNWNLTNKYSELDDKDDQDNKDDNNDRSPNVWIFNVKKLYIYIYIYICVRFCKKLVVLYGKPYVLISTAIIK